MVRRTNVLRLTLSISAAAAAAYLAVLYLMRPSADAVVTAASLMAFLPLLYSFVFSMSTIGFERLWISFAVDQYAYIRYRMLARAALMAISLAPLAAAYATSYFAYPPAAYLVPALICAVLTTPQTSWIFAAAAEMPQVLSLPAAPPRLNVKYLLLSLAALLIIAIYMVPYGLAVAAYWAHLGPLARAAFWSSTAEVAASTAFFYLTLFSKAGRSLWSSFVNRLSELGYV
ncbi:MAG: hypothetical protein TU35_007600 [Thermoproteus sp. AZ2]|jgi:hypothetical protein|uniref:Uncharacterized protein n=1 Tax=Thermoproteus sp. AZ2 TaxID=1609232 RepID=A0ACC6V2V1_9CREN